MKLFSLIESSFSLFRGGLERGRVLGLRLFGRFWCNWGWRGANGLTARLLLFDNLNAALFSPWRKVITTGNDVKIRIHICHRIYFIKKRINPYTLHSLTKLLFYWVFISFLITSKSNGLTMAARFSVEVGYGMRTFNGVWVKGVLKSIVFMSNDVAVNPHRIKSAS